MKSGPPVALIALLVLSSTSWAGSRESPEIVDPTGLDDSWVDTDFLSVRVPLPELDIARAWVESNPENVSFYIEVLDLDHRTVSPNQHFAFAWTFHVPDYQFSSLTAAHMPWTFETWEFRFSAYDHAEKSTRSRVFGSIDGNVIRMDVPRHLLGDADALEKPVVSSTLGTTLGIAVFGNGVWFRDNAPNEGYGPTIPIN